MLTSDPSTTSSSNFTVLGQLAAGIAHEINTPSQYVSDNLFFLQDAFEALHRVLKHFEILYTSVRAGSVKAKAIQELEEAMKHVEMDYLLNEIPGAIRQSLEGMTRITQIVEAMRDFSHPGHMEKKVVDINKSIHNTIMVTRNIWKQWADVETDLDGTLPKVPCQPGEINQVILNLIVNAVDAIADAINGSPGQKGTIRIQSIQNKGWVEIRISDTGTGIPESIQPKIFNYFFTTKPVGKGTGQGLAICASVMANHGGSISFETRQGAGTTFILRLPLSDSEA